MINKSLCVLLFLVAVNTAAIFGYGPAIIIGLILSTLAGGFVIMTTLIAAIVLTVRGITK